MVPLHVSFVPNFWGGFHMMNSPFQISVEMSKERKKPLCYLVIQTRGGSKVHNHQLYSQQTKQYLKV